MAAPLPDSQNGPACAYSLALKMPRRPRRSNFNTSWDPNLDIFDDTCETKPASCQPRTSPQECKVQQGRLNVLSKVPQRKPLGSSGTIKRNAGNIGNKRLSVVQENGQLDAQGYTGGTDSDQIQSLTCPNLRLEPRRRRTKLHIPPDETMVVNIHPEQDLKVADINSLDVTKLSPDQGETAEQRTPTIARRRSLAIAPRKAPLQTSTRPNQPHHIAGDVAGSGSGKENIPPWRAFGAVKHNGPENISWRRTSTDSRYSASALPPMESQSEWLTKPSDSFLPTARRHSYQVKSTQQRLHGSNAAVTCQPTNRDQYSEATNFSCFDNRDESFDIERNPSSAAAKLKAHPHLLRRNVVGASHDDAEGRKRQEETIRDQINHIFDMTTRNPSKHLHFEEPHDRGLVLRLQEIYDDPTYALLRKRLQASLVFGALSIPKSVLADVSQFKLDILKRQRFLDLWLKTYNLRSLHCVAQVVLGQVVAVESQSSDSSVHFQAAKDLRTRRKSLEELLMSFLLLNKDCWAEKVACDRSNTNSLSGVGDGNIDAAAWCWRRTVIRSLMMVLLLDMAQGNGIFGQCLFQTSSQFKSSGAVVQALGSLLLPSVGNINRVLHHLSFRIHPAQDNLDKPSYRISNLAIDLRNGALLAKLVEILLYAVVNPGEVPKDCALQCSPRDASKSVQNAGGSRRSLPLSRTLKMPCMSRTQKLYNVQLSLDALNDVPGFQGILGGIEARHIVDGHREKTVYLLRMILGQYRTLCIIFD